MSLALLRAGTFPIPRQILSTDVGWPDDIGSRPGLRLQSRRIVQDPDIRIPGRHSGKSIE